MRFSKRMHTWEQFHGWMELRNLDQGHGLTQAYTIGYRFIDRHDDMWTKQFNDFKKKRRPALRGGAGLMGSTVPELVRKLGINTTKIAFVPGLSSNENIASSSGVLSKLTCFCAQKTNVKFIRNAITKKPHEPLHTGNKDRIQRREILDGAEFSSHGLSGLDNVFVFDDVITTGATLSHIARAIREENPFAEVYGVALCKSDSQNYNRENFDRELTNDHIPKQWNKIWKESE